MLSTAYIALGANLGDPASQVSTAMTQLDRLPQSRLLATSSLYRSAPQGNVTQQPDYVNAAAALQTNLPPYALLDALLEIETQYGRVRGLKNAARELDIDLLLYGDEQCSTLDLSLPHPRMHLRAFVVLPLLEIASDLWIPGRGPLAAWLPAVAYQKVHQINL